jgi:O-antigen/teichoic acid export membrane protein
MISPDNTTGRSLARVARNIASLLTSDVINRATTFVMYAVVARYAGARSFGQLSLGILLVYTFQVLACGGLPTLITRELATRKRRTAKYLVASSVVVALTSILATLAMVLFTVLMQYEADTSTVLLILAIGLAPQSLATIAEAVFRSWECMHYIAYANVPINLAKMAGAFLLLRNGYGVNAVAMLVVGCRAATLLVEWALLAWRLPRFVMRIDLGFARRLAIGGATFLGIDGLIAVWGSLDSVLISKMCGETDVGLYSAAWQLLVPASLLFTSMVSSVFPLMCQKVKADQGALGDFVKWMVELLCLVGFPMAIGLFFLAEPSLLLLYGDAEFIAAASIVHVLLAVVVLQAVTNVLGYALWAGLQERISLRIVAVNVVVNLVLGVVLTYYFGVIGAAFASLATWAVNAIQTYLAFARFSSRVSIVEAAWKAAVASLAMVGCFVALQSSGMVMASVTASVAYIAVVAALLVAAAGGVREFCSDFFSPLVE